MAQIPGYRTFADFERDAIRPGMRAGWTLDELEMPDNHRNPDFDLDPFEAALREAEADEDY